MSDAKDRPDATSHDIADEQLPDDLRPGDDNPLAGGLDERETVDDLLDDGKHAEQDEQDEEHEEHEEHEEGQRADGP